MGGLNIETGPRRSEGTSIEARLDELERKVARWRELSALALAIAIIVGIVFVLNFASDVQEKSDLRGRVFYIEHPEMRPGR